MWGLKSAVTLDAGPRAIPCCEPASLRHVCTCNIHCSCARWIHMGDGPQGPFFGSPRSSPSRARPKAYLPLVSRRCRVGSDEGSRTSGSSMRTVRPSIVRRWCSRGPMRSAAAAPPTSPPRWPMLSMREAGWRPSAAL